MAGDFDLSARITADATGLVQASAQAEGALERVDRAERDAAGGARELETATGKATAAQGQHERGSKALAAAQTNVMRATKGATTETIGEAVARERAARETLKTAAAEERLSAATSNAERAQAAAALAALKLEQAQNRLGNGVRNVDKDLNRQAFAMRNAGQQFGDFATQVSLGSGIAQAFAAQAGQMGYALSEFGGRLGKVGAFLTGPWGIALTVAAVVAAPFIGKLFEGGSAADEFAERTAQAATAADSFGNAQSLLGKVLDLTTGKLKTQNTVLIESIRLQALAGIAKARADQQTTGAQLDDIGQGTGNRTIAQRLASGFLTGNVGAGADPRLSDIGSRYRAGTVDIVTARKEVEKLGLSAKATNDALLTLVKFGTAKNDETSFQDVLNALDGKGVNPRLKPYERPDKPKKPKSTEARDEFGRDAADKIAGIVGQFDDAPSVIDKTNAKVRELDDLIDDLGRKKPIGFEDLIAKAEAAKVVVREGLIREVAKAFEQPKTLGEKAGAALAQLDAVIADLNKAKPVGFEKLVTDAERAKDVVRDGLQKPYRDFVKSQEDSLAVGALVLQGRRDEADALRTIQSLQAQGVVLTTEQKAAILATTQAVRAQGRAIDENRARNEKYLEAIRGIKGIVEDATQAFVRGDLGQLIKSPGKLLDVFQTLNGRKLFDRVFGGLFEELADQVNGTSVVKDAADKMATAVDKAAASIVKLGNAADVAAGGVGGAPVPGTGGTAREAANGDIVVNGRRDPVASAISRSVERIAGQFTNPEQAAKLGQQIGRFAGKGLEGAATGSIVSGIGKALGIKMSSTGAQLGGAAGAFLPIPGGQIIGSIVGGLAGNLFAPRARPGGATVTSANGQAIVGGSTGSDRAGIQIGKDLAGSVASGINAIAQQLGGGLGTFSVSIGKYKDDLRVNTNGRALGGVKGSGATGFGDDQAAAVSFAISQAIAQGAVTGLSDAVRKALSSSSNVDQALAEALKVREVETLIGGLGSALKQQFDAFGRSAAERVRVAKQYGLDLVAVEKINGEQRAKLVDDSLKARIGSLSDFLDSLKFGDLAEGTAADKRAALLKEIDAVRVDAEAGKDGAADKLASLYSNLLATSRDAYGTAGAEYSGDRSAAQSAVERVIRMETDRVNQAAGAQQAAQATTDAVKEGNALTSETNDLLARQAVQLGDLVSAFERLGFGGGLGVDYGATARDVSLV